MDGQRQAFASPNPSPEYLRDRTERAPPMVRWFRHYPGLARDGKLVAVALRSGQPIERVVWTWCAILEDAAERMDNGSFRLDLLEAAHFLRCSQADLQTILDALDENGRTQAGVIVAWDARQFRDNSTARVRAHRARSRGTSIR